MHGRLAENVALLQAVAQGAGELPADVRVGVCVPSPYLAQTQSLLEGSPGRVGRAGRVRVHAWRLYRRSGCADGGGFRRDVRDRRALGASCLSSRKRRTGRGEDAACAGSGFDADRLRRRNARRARSRFDRAGSRRATGRSAGEAVGARGGASCRRVRAGLGDRHRQERERRSRRRRSMRSCVRVWRQRARRWRMCRCCTAAV